MNWFYIEIEIDYNFNILRCWNFPTLTLKVNSIEKYIIITTVYKASYFSEAVKYLQILVKKLETYRCNVLSLKIQSKQSNHVTNHVTNQVDNNIKYDINIHLIIENSWESQIKNLNLICEKNGYHLVSLEQFNADSKPIIKLKSTETYENILECLKKQSFFIHDLIKQDFIISFSC